MDGWIALFIIFVRSVWVFAVWFGFFYGVFVLNHSGWWVILALLLTAGGLTKNVKVTSRS